MKFKQYLIATIGLFSVLAACETKPDVSPVRPVSPAIGGTVTEIGQLQGTPVSQIIGPEGGSLSTPDGTVRLTLPAGAISQATTITILPITSHTPNGIGQAYRFSPDGLQFSKPATLTFQYTNEQVSANDADMLKVAYQGANKVWYNVTGARVDTQQKRISVPMAHFSDWSAYEIAYFDSFILTSGQETSAESIAYGETMSIHIFETIVAEDESIQRLASENVGEVKDVKWSIIGQGKLETVQSKKGIRYVAPAKGDKRITVTVNAELTFQNSPKKLILVKTIYVSNNYVEVTFKGQTQLYTDVSLAQVTTVDGNRLWEINAGKSETNYLTFTIFGESTGTFPFGNPLKTSSGISAGHYNFGKYAYRTSYACVGDFQNGLQLTQGSVVIDEFIKNKLAIGKFSGSLMTDDGEEDCPTKLVPISGSFHLTR
ncbi:hypothetical protein GCM10028807_26130 [Spirosoma daeguense]